jgi:hypothetical protein
MSNTKANGGYPECDSCLNREFDPFQCESCDDGSNYEPEEEMAEEFDDDGSAYRNFITWIKEIA